MEQELAVTNRRAGWVPRLGAYLLDLFLMSPLFALALVMMGYSEKDMQTTSDIDVLAERLAEDSDTLTLVFVVLLVAFFTYRVLAQKFFGRTVGKAATGLVVVVHESADRPSLDRLVIRELIVVFAAVIPVAGIFVYLGDGVSMFTNNQGRTWHDRAAGTEVIPSDL